MLDNKIDVVILWVDGTDDDWIKMYNKYAPIHMKKSSNRYRDWDTIRYVFRGIERFMPWVNKIHFVTCGQKPSWMVDEHPKINFISHDNIFKDKVDLPVFNSSAIELNIHRIPNLASKFIYFNDDTLVLKETSRVRFFKNNLPIDFLIETLPRRGALYNRIRKPDAWSSMINNCIDLINANYSKNVFIHNNKNLYYSDNYPRKYKLQNYFMSAISNKYVAFKHYHHPQPYLRSTLENVELKYPSEFNRTFKSRFRAVNNLSQAIFRYTHLVSGDFYPEYFTDHACINVSNKKSADKCISALRTKRFVCVNDELNDEASDVLLIESIMKVVNSILPDKSTFEV